MLFFIAVCLASLYSFSYLKVLSHPNMMRSHVCITIGNTSVLKKPVEHPMLV